MIENTSAMMKNADTWTSRAESEGMNDDLRELLADDTAIRDRCIELVSRFEAVTEA
ncbi:hypothetical protein [Streptomyces sp. Amel2xC10]|uniref:hypothetical protein n=1 Tax=Streptomyces sp. Amel2xC10 TaxID=1305826 RepID=UPI000A08A4B1|nr:hypothetical protein [Streptomyces sp. Amel2xC10]SMF86700.1 hypothetical protein SAMN02745830_07210 [Streptomyces sp. Amel2xC10]